MSVDEEELAIRFTYHPPRNGQVDRYQEIREAGRQMAMFILETTPESREQSLALTALDEVVMWANAAIARREP
jgi:hypothetical protein